MIKYIVTINQKSLKSVYYYEAETMSDLKLQIIKDTIEPSKVETYLNYTYALQCQWEQQGNPRPNDTDHVVNLMFDYFFGTRYTDDWDIPIAEVDIKEYIPESPIFKKADKASLKYLQNMEHS